MERKFLCHPAYDKRNPDPKKNYGIHGVTMCFYVVGDKGAVSFVLFTNWYLPEVQEEMDKNPLNPSISYFAHKPLPADLGYHSKTPMWEGQESMGECDFLDGAPCYYDGTSIGAADVFEILLRDGSDGIWKELEERYQLHFEKKEEEE